MDWMYEGTAIKNTSAEEFLLGKPIGEGSGNSRKEQEGWKPMKF
jgi:hypothetical protein